MTKRWSAMPSTWMMHAAAVASICGLAPVWAAEVTRVDRQLCTYAITGEFQSGDSERIRRALNSAEVHRLYRAHSERNSLPLPAVCLDSVGGDYLEAVSLAKHFASFGIGTVVERDAKCFSACALIFMAGTTYYSDAADMPESEGELGTAWMQYRRLHIGGKIGFHAPFLRLGEATGNGTFSKETVEAAYQSAMLAVAEFLELSRRHGMGSRSPLIKQGLIAEMLRRGPDQLFEIDTIDKAGRWEVELLGFAVVSPQSSQRVARGRACYNVARWKSDLPAVPEARGAPLDEVVKDYWAHGWTANEAADYVDSSADRRRQMFTYSAGFEAEEVCQVASTPSSRSTGDDYTIAYQERSSGMSIGTIFSVEAHDGTKLFQGAPVPEWYLLDPSTPIARLGTAQSAPQGKAAAPTAFERFSNIAYRWTGQTATTIDTIDACERSCSQSASCLGYTYFTTQRLCRQMTELSEKVSDPRAVSGRRR